MKIFKLFQAGFYLLALTTSQNIATHEFWTTENKFSANDIQNVKHHHECSGSHFGQAGFGVTDPNLWYTITTNSYPEVTLLSQQRNQGLNEGGVYLSPTGFTIGEAGNYFVCISAVLHNPGVEPILLPVFLVQNETFDGDNPGPLGGVVIVQPGVFLNNVHGSGILTNVEPGTRLSLVATNGGYPEPKDVVVAGWGITLFKLP